MPPLSGKFFTLLPTELSHHREHFRQNNLRNNREMDAIADKAFTTEKVSKSSSGTCLFVRFVSPSAY